MTEVIIKFEYPESMEKEINEWIKNKPKGLLQVNK